MVINLGYWIEVTKFDPRGEFAQADNNDPALALFWAIWEVIHAH